LAPSPTPVLVTKLTIRILVTLLALTTPRAASADFIFSFSSPADVNHIAVGQVVRFDVLLSGIDTSDPGTFLSYLAATTQHDNTLLSAPAAVDPGQIVPDILNFAGTPLADGADGFYDSVFFVNSQTPISSNGIFFSFDVTALNVGTGMLTFSSSAATLASDPDQHNQFTPLTDSLRFTVEGPSVIAPEPGTLALLLPTCAGAGGAAFLRYFTRALRGRMRKHLEPAR
jgi:hypothetical protein